jgi:hypothetical protein
MRFLVPIALLALAACAREQSTAKRVEPSAPDSKLKRIVSFNQPGEHGTTLIAPACLRIDKGFTVEFRNYSPEQPLMLNGLSGPETIYSPNIVEPYNFSPATAESAEYAFWRRRFTQTGIYEYYDASSASGGTPAGGSYYGPAAFTTGSASAIEGTVCVEDSSCVPKDDCKDSVKAATMSREDCCTFCEKVCCTGPADCGDETLFTCEGAPQGRCIRKAQ